MTGRAVEIPRPRLRPAPPKLAPLAPGAELNDLRWGIAVGRIWEGSAGESVVNLTEIDTTSGFGFSGEGEIGGWRRQLVACDEITGNLKPKWKLRLI